MSVLADRDIRAELESGRVRIDPYDPADLQPSSVDLHLDRSFRVFRNNRYAFIDPRTPQPDLTELLTVADDEPFILHPGEFVLGQTTEWVELPDDLVARLEGRSSLGRIGLLIHSTAGARRAGVAGTNDAVHWRTDLGGGTSVALIQAGTLRTDAGAIMGPVDRKSVV